MTFEDDTHQCAFAVLSGDHWRFLGKLGTVLKLPLVGNLHHVKHGITDP